MTTKLDSEIKRELAIGSDLYTLTLSPTGFTLVLKGRRKGLTISWSELVSGDAALATALNASLAAPLRSKPQVSKRPTRSGDAPPKRANKRASGRS